MDTIKHEFRGSVRPYYDRPDIVVPVQWYHAAPGAAITGPTAFANITNIHSRFVPHVGINREFYPNYPGNVGGFRGVRQCGTDFAWLNGVSFNNPAPLCACVREAMMPVQEVPTGLVNSTNRNFMLSQLPISAMSCLVFVNGVQQIQGVNYSLSGQAVRFTGPSTPRTGAGLIAYYWVAT